ncbi:MAG: hypothetical protein WD066_00235 [Planctomycetaceae bacterium]
MNRFPAAVCGLMLLFAPLTVVEAQNPAQNPAQNAPNGASPGVLFMQAGGDRLMEDLQYMLGLTSPQERQQWQHVKDWVEEMFLPGIDSVHPVGMDVILSNQATRYRPQFPIKNLQDFRKNLDAFGIPSRKKTASLYQLERNFPGYMRYRHGYAIIGEKETDVPLTLPNPMAELVPLVQAGFDMALRLRNDPQGLDARRADFQRIRNDLLATVKQNADETREDFDVRRTAAEQQMNELERFYVESRHVLLGWVTDSQQNEGRLDITLEPIAGTPLAQSVALLGQQPSYFANAPQAENSILSLRVNHPLDALRQQHALQFLPVAKAAMHRRIDEDADRNDDEKKAGKEALDKALDIIDATVKQGMGDLVVEVATRQTGKHAMVIGVRVADGNKVHEIVQMLPQAKKTRQVQMDVARVGQTRIHKVDMRFPQANVRQDFYGQDLGLYVGGDADAVWFAVGEGALSDLTAAIGAVAQPNVGKNDDPFVDLMVKLHPWLELRNQLDPLQPKAPGVAQPRPRPAPAPAGEEGSVVEDFTRQLDRAELRRMALEAFAAGHDVFRLRLSRKDKEVVGGMTVERGVLRMVGKGMAKFSEENLAP